MIRKAFLMTIFSLFVVTFLLPQPADAQNLSDCFARKVNNPDIVCSLCGTEFEEESSYCQDSDGNYYDNYFFDQALCKCINSDIQLNKCDSFDSAANIKDQRDDCYRRGEFWAEPYCACYALVYTGDLNQDPTDQVVFTQVQQVDETFEEFKDSIFFDTNYDGSIDNLAELIRMGFIVAFAVIAVISAFIGFYGMGLYSTAGENDEQVQKAQSVLKNGLIGLAVAVLGIAIIQIVAVILGVADSIGDTSFDLSNV
ncbi:hypothetical protein GF389_03515 [Candidatus Dojkabacteria bacterium]|nr:hypothetical protein [Candidatus Dojkabacteria bacterium]